jgi:hypothetical protein
LSPTVSEGKILAEVARLLVQNRLRLWFSAGISIPGVIKRTVQTAVQVGAAGRAGISPTNAILRRDFLLAAMAGLHSEVSLLRLSGGVATSVERSILVL